MKKDKINIDEFFKEYNDSLPELNISEEKDQNLKNLIFEQVLENRLRGVNKNTTLKNRANFFKKYRYINIAAASFLLVLALYLIVKKQSNFDLKKSDHIVIKDTLEIKPDYKKTEPIEHRVDSSKFEVVQIAQINYDITLRSLEHKHNSKEYDQILSIILEEFNSKNLQTSTLENEIFSAPFIYQSKISKLKIKIDRNSKDITFILLRKDTPLDELGLIKINPQIIIQNIEKKILSLIAIE